MALMSSTEPRDHSKICIAASTGGHLDQMLKTAPAWEERNCFFVISSKSAKAELKKRGLTYCLGEANRLNPLRRIFFGYFTSTVTGAVIYNNYLLIGVISL